MNINSYVSLPATKSLEQETLVPPQIKRRNIISPPVNSEVSDDRQRTLMTVVQPPVSQEYAQQILMRGKIFDGFSSKDFSWFQQFAILEILAHLLSFSKYFSSRLFAILLVLEY